MSDYMIKTITVKKEHNKWLKNHPELNFSGFIQMKLQELIDEDNKKNNKKR